MYLCFYHRSDVTDRIFNVQYMKLTRNFPLMTTRCPGSTLALFMRIKSASVLPGMAANRSHRRRELFKALLRLIVSSTEVHLKYGPALFFCYCIFSCF